MRYRYPFPLTTIPSGGEWGSTLGRPSPHRGVDFSKVRGATGNIPSVADGVVVLKQWSSFLGWVTVIEHDDGMFSGYCHSAAMSPLALGVRYPLGATVNQVGGTGTAVTGNPNGGPHLHLTLSAHSTGIFQGVTFDPIPYITARLSGTAGGGVTPINDRSTMFSLIKDATPGSATIFVASTVTGIRTPIKNMVDYNILDQYRKGVDGQALMFPTDLDTVAAYLRVINPLPAAPGIAESAAAVKLALAPDFATIPTAPQNGAAARAAIVK